MWIIPLSRHSDSPTSELSLRALALAGARKLHWSNPLHLRQNLYWCECAGRAIFLDAEADRYFGLSPAVNDAFLHLADSSMDPANSSALQPLISRGMLIEDEAERIFRAEWPLVPATHDLNADGHVQALPKDIALILMAELAATWHLRMRSFKWVLTDVSRRVGSPPPQQEPDQSLLAIAAASSAASLFTRSHDRCLVRALAVHSTCRRRGFASKLVFGVRSNPFTAHCWVQLDSAVLVGAFEQVRLYRPILVVE